MYHMVNICHRLKAFCIQMQHDLAIINVRGMKIEFLCFRTKPSVVVFVCSLCRKFLLFCLQLLFECFAKDIHNFLNHFSLYEFIGLLFVSSDVSILNMRKCLPDRASLFYLLATESVQIEWGWVASMACAHCIKFTTFESMDIYHRNSQNYSAKTAFASCRLSGQHIFPHFYAFLSIALSKFTNMDDTLRKSITSTLLKQ